MPGRIEETLGEADHERPGTRVVQARVELADPHVMSDIRDRRGIIDAIYDALVRRGPTGRFEPWLARSWSMSPDCRHWRFHLRAGVRCHDGGTLTAEDAAASLRRAIAPDLPGELGTQGVLRGYLDGTLIEVSDELTLDLTTPAPLADLLDLLVDIPVVPERALGDVTVRPVGSGPYRFESAGPGRISLTAFDAHWGGPPSLSRVDWRAEPEAGERARLYGAGETDWCVDPPRAGTGEAAHRLQTPSSLCIIMLFNLMHGPATDPRVRQALHQATDVKALIADPRIMAGTARQLAGPVAPGQNGADASVAPYPYDPARARHLLLQAGHRDGLALTMDCPARFPDEAVPLAHAIAGQWRDVGVSCEIRVHHDRPAYAEQVRRKDIGDLCCFDSSPESTYRVFCEKLDDRRQGPWWLGYRNPALNRLLDQAAETGDDAQRNAIFAAAFRLVHEDAPWLFLYAPDRLWLRSPVQSGFIPSVEGRLRF